ncbi:MAG: DUF3592 domain-containing protein [Planctomycetaceae bacterium]|nr:DUF3592 domain-containing protein [Planctomycetaceae bacterium]
MPITVTCDECFTSVRVKDQALGKKFRCKECGAVVVVRPDEDFEDPATPPPRQKPKSLPRMPGATATATKKRSSGRRKKRSGGSGTFTSLVDRANDWYGDHSTFKALFYLMLGMGMSLALPFIAWATISQFQSSMASTEWPQASAYMIDGSITSRMKRSGRFSSRKVFTPHLSYRFMVDGRSYVGKQLSYGEDDFYSEAEAQAVLTRYAPGSEHPVYYDPEDPEENVLQPGSTASNWLMFFFPAIFLAGPVMVVLHGMVVLRRMRIA